MKIFRQILREEAVFFIAGAILSAAIDLVFKIALDRYIGMVLIFVSIFILYTIATIHAMRKSIDTRVNNLGLSSVWASGARVSYQQAADIIGLAKRSILVLTPYAPSGIQVTLATPKDRSPYLTAIEKVVENRLDSSDETPFVYKRILQSEQANQVDKVLRKAYLKQSPAFTFEHCKTLFAAKAAKPNDKVEIDFFICEPITSNPSLLIVDNRYILIAMASLFHRLGDPQESYGFFGSLIVEDRIGQMAEDFEQILEKIIRLSCPIYTIED